MDINAVSGSSKDHGHQHGSQQQHELWKYTGPPVAVWNMVHSMIPGDSIDHKPHHGLHHQHCPWTSTCFLGSRYRPQTPICSSVATWTTNIYIAPEEAQTTDTNTASSAAQIMESIMASGDKRSHRHTWAWSPGRTQTRETSTVLGMSI